MVSVCVVKSNIHIQAAGTTGSIPPYRDSYPLRAIFGILEAVAHIFAHMMDRRKSCMTTWWDVVSEFSPCSFSE